MKISANTDISKQMIQSATMGAIFLIVFGLVSSVGGYLKGGIVSWQDYILLVTPMIVFTLGLVSLVLLRREKTFAGSSLVFIANLMLSIVAILLQRGLGWAVFIYALTSSLLLIWRAMPKITRNWTAILTALTLVFIVVMEWLNPSIRLAAVNELSTFYYVASAILAMVFIAQAVYQSWSVINSSINNRLTALVLVITVPLLIGVTTYISLKARNEIETQALHNLQQNNESLTTNVSTWLELHVRTLHEMALLPDIKSMNAVRQKPALLAIANAHPNLFLVHTINLNGINIARSDDADLNDYHDRAWFLGAKEGSSITFEALISRTIGKPALSMSTPIYDGYGRIIGVASIVSELSEISKEVLASEEGQGIVYIVDDKNRVVAHPDPSYTEGELRDLSAYPPVAAIREGKKGQINFTDENGVEWIAYVNTLDNNWGIVAQQTKAELFASVRQFQTTASILILIGAVGIFALTWFAIRRSLQPIGELTETVSVIAAGDLNREAKVKTQDEIGVLASAFNDMTSKLREFIGTLESRVAERTRNLELAAEVGRTVSQVRALDVMLKDAAELIRRQFDLYYVQVYLTDASQTELILQSGTGRVGEQLISRRHSLPLNINSINGRAAVEKRSVVISDTTASAIFKPNPLLPNTRSEMAVPLMVGDKVVGVLDMQSEKVGSLSQENIPAFEALAGQLAIAIQNANLLEEAKQAREEVEAQARRLTRTNWAEYLDAIHKPEETGYVFEQNKIAPLTQKEQAKENAMIAPISVTGEMLGNLVVEMEGKARIAQTEELVNTVARQVAQHIENLRLLDSAERFRFEAEQASRRLTHEGWQEYMAENADKGLEYLYDLNEVRPLASEEKEQAEGDGISLPLKVRDEAIGRIIVKGAKGEDAASLVNAVAERLSTHIEGLRLSMQTEQALASTKKQAQREQALRQITSAVRGSTDPAVILRTAARELGNILGRQTIVHMETAGKTKGSQADHPSEDVREVVVNNGNEPASSEDRS